MYKLFSALCFLLFSYLSYASPTSSYHRSVSANLPRDAQPTASFASVIVNTKAQLEAASLPLLASEDALPSDSEILQCLTDVSEALFTANKSLKQLSSQSDSVIHAAYSKGRILPQKQLSDERLARTFAPLIYALRAPMQSGAFSTSDSITAAFRNATAATKSLISTSNEIIPGMSSLIRPLVHPLLPMLRALDIGL
ncbi:hypothetical protein FRC00_003722 [Tulasnella sp. 408]|nr:hypothetical protein FRC00_003722 [Tulasnella sp. 408]